MKHLHENWREYLDEEQGSADPCWDGYRKAGMKKKGDKMVPNCVPLEEEVIEEEVIEEKDDACTRKVKSRYKVWPSAYASGALVKCRKVGAANWGNKSKKNENVDLEESEPLEEKKKKAGTESSKESSLKDWFGRKGAKGKSKGWVDCNSPDGDGGYKSCGRKEGEKRSKYPACRPTPGACKEKGKGKSWGKKAKKESLTMTKNELSKIITEEVETFLNMQEAEQESYEVDAIDENEEYCPVCADTMDEAKKKKACKPSKGKRFAKRVDGKCRSFGQAGQAKSGGDRIRPGTKKGDAYCARSAGIKKCKNPPCANTLSRKKWKCRGKKSMKEGDVIDFSAYKDKKAPKSWKPDEMLLIIKIEKVVNDTLEEIFGLDVPEEVLENLESFLQSMEYNLE